MDEFTCPEEEFYLDSDADNWIGSPVVSGTTCLEDYCGMNSTN